MKSAIGGIVEFVRQSERRHAGALLRDQRLEGGAAFVRRRRALQRDGRRDAASLRVLARRFLRASAE